MATLMMIEDGRLRLVAAPAAPPLFHCALAAGIRPGPNAGSCGSAAYFGELAIGADIASAATRDLDMIAASAATRDLDMIAASAATRDLDMIAASARRMSEPIDGLLEFSRLGRGGVSFQRVATSTLVTEVVDQACGAFAHRPSVEIGILPDLFGDPAMLRQVWVNLIFNAFKFSAQVAAPRIAIGCRVADGEIDFSVVDNGAGFDPGYTEWRLLKHETPNNVNT